MSSITASIMVIYNCDLKVTGSSREIGYWKQVRPPTIHPSGCGPSSDPAYMGCFVHRAALFITVYILAPFVVSMLVPGSYYNKTNFIANNPLL